MNTDKWVLYLPYITTYLVAYKKTTIGWILYENKRLCISPPALRRCAESQFSLPVSFHHFKLLIGYQGQELGKRMQQVVLTVFSFISFHGTIYNRHLAGLMC